MKVYRPRPPGWIGERACRYGLWLIVLMAVAGIAYALIR